MIREKKWLKEKTIFLSVHEIIDEEEVSWLPTQMKS
jgi:hypothetical protein